MKERPLKIFATSAGLALAHDVCRSLSTLTDRPVEVGQAEVKRYNDGEIRVKILENVRGTDSFVIGPTSPPKENAWEMRLIAETLYDSSAERITLIPTILGDNRADRKDESRVPVSGAKVMIDFLKGFTTGNGHRVLLLDVHSEPTIGFFKPELISDHLYASSLTVPHLKGLLTPPFVIASPDKGGGPRATAFAKRLGQEDVVLFWKERLGPGGQGVDEAKVRIIGDVADRDVIFVDDMIDTGGTIIADAKAAKAAGAKRVLAVATHAVFSNGAVAKLDACAEIDEVIVTDTIRHKPSELATTRLKLTVLPSAPLFARAIRLLHENESLSPLFE